MMLNIYLISKLKNNTHLLLIYVCMKAVLIGLLKTKGVGVSSQKAYSPDRGSYSQSTEQYTKLYICSKILTE